MLFLSCQSGCCLHIGSDVVCVLLLFAAWGVSGSDVVHVRSYRFWRCLRLFISWGAIGPSVIYAPSLFWDLSVLALSTSFHLSGSYRFWCCLRRFAFCSLGSYVFWRCFHAFSFGGVIGFGVVYVSPFIFWVLSVLPLFTPLHLLESYRSWCFLQLFTFWRVIGPDVAYAPSPFGEFSVLALFTPLHLLESYRSWCCLRPFAVC